ncbi:6076_t:CDS:2, partial [Dentiscutata erythropus]
SSCIICYPTSNNPSDQFKAFWNWFIFISSAYQFSRITTEIFDQYIHNFNIPIQTRIVDRLLSKELENFQNLKDYVTTDSNTETSDDEEPDLIGNLINMNNSQ